MVLASHPNISKFLKILRVCRNVCVNGWREAPNIYFDTLWRVAPKIFFAQYKA